MTHLEDIALGVAIGAHARQKDKGGLPYLGHPIRVASHFPKGSLEAVVALLHDVVEDTGVRLDDLDGHFPLAVVEAVDALTRRPHEGDRYYERVRANPLALAVKFADIADNTAPVRMIRLHKAERVRLQAKYAHALEVLHDGKVPAVLHIVPPGNDSVTE